MYTKIIYLFDPASMTIKELVRKSYSWDDMTSFKSIIKSIKPKLNKMNLTGMIFIVETRKNGEPYFSNSYNTNILKTI